MSCTQFCRPSPWTAIIAFKYKPGKNALGILAILIWMQHLQHLQWTVCLMGDNHYLDISNLKYPSSSFGMHYTVAHSIIMYIKITWMCAWHIFISWRQLFKVPHVNHQVWTIWQFWSNYNSFWSPNKVLKTQFQFISTKLHIQSQLNYNWQIISPGFENCNAITVHHWEEKPAVQASYMRHFHLLDRKHICMRWVNITDLVHNTFI